MIRKLLAFIILVFLFSTCSVKNEEDPNSAAYLKHLSMCRTGCNNLAILIEEGDGLMGCYQWRTKGDMTCAQQCAYKIKYGEKLDPICWARLKKCENFEEQCNFGDLY